MKVATGDSHGIWLKTDGTVWVWGGNSQGQLGTGGDDESEPVQVPGLRGIRDIAAGDFFSAAVKDDGTLWTWGDNDDGQLGNGTQAPSSAPVRVASLDGVVAVSAGGRHVAALRSDGTVWEWGFDGTSRPSNLPKQVDGLTGVTAIAASDGHCVALKSDGTVWVRGDHGAGDLGDGSYNYSWAPRQLLGLSNIVAIGAGHQLTLAVKKDGTVWAEGYGAAGQMGNGAKENSTRPVMVSGLAGVRAVAGGYMHALALKEDGTVWSWGYNHEHQLGNTRVDTEESAKPVRSGTLANVAAIAASDGHSVALTGDGVAWGWGDNQSGVLGVDSENLKRSDVPMRIGQDVPLECNPLFACLTDSGKVIRICGTQNQADVDKWTEIQYRYGPESGPPELAFPEDPSTAPPSLYFAHESKKNDYRVTVRFTNGAYTYRVYSSTKTGAGVEVEDAKGKVLSDIRCAERPYMFIEYMRMNLPCDMENPHGAAACREHPYGGK